MEKTIQKSQCVLSNELPRLYVLPTGRWRHVLQCFFFFFSSTSVEVLLVWMLLKKKNDSEDGCVPQPLFPISHEHRRGQSPGNVSGSYLCCPLHSRARFKFKRFGVRIIGDG